MIKVLLLEDEAANRHLVRQILTDYIDDVIIVSECSTLNQALDFIQNSDDSLVILLDIELGSGTNGLDLLQYLSKDKHHVIVTSAFPEYAIKAFRLEVIDFLTKPLSISEMQAAFQRLQGKITTTQGTAEFSGNNAPQIGIQLFNKTLFIDEQSIVKVQSDLTGIKVFLDTGKILRSIERIGLIEARLSVAKFARIDKSNLVQIQSITHHQINEQGQLQLELISGETLIVSRRRKAAVLSLLA